MNGWVESIEEGQVLATVGLVFLVHEHLAPVVKHDGGVVWVTHGSAEFAADYGGLLLFKKRLMNSSGVIGWGL